LTLLGNGVHVCSNVAKFNFKALVLQNLRACVGILTNLDNLDFDKKIGRISGSTCWGRLHLSIHSLLKLVNHREGLFGFFESPIICPKEWL